MKRAQGAKYRLEWEEIANDPWTLRLPVPGGYLYNVVSLSESGAQYVNAVAFVPVLDAHPELS